MGENLIMDDETKTNQLLCLTLQIIERERQIIEKENKKLKLHVDQLLEFLRDRDYYCYECIICERFDFIEEMISCEYCHFNKICKKCQKHYLNWEGEKEPAHIVDALAKFNLTIIKKNNKRQLRCNSHLHEE